MKDYSNHSSRELSNLISQKILRYAELLRKAGRKSMNVEEQEEYVLLKSELLELHAVIQLENEKVCLK